MTSAHKSRLEGELFFDAAIGTFRNSQIVAIPGFLDMASNVGIALKT